jgi:type I restriction enzyme, S subunit
MSKTQSTWNQYLPTEWEIATIGQLAVRVGSGVTPTGGSKVYTDSGAIFIRSQNVTNSGLLLDDVAFIDQKTHLQMSGSEVFPFDVLLNITGASIGRCCSLPDGFGPANVNQHVCAIRLPEPDPHDAKFLSSVLASPIGQNQIFRLNAGGNREGLNYQQLKSFRVPWPPKKWRRAIAEILSTLDEAIEQTESLIAKYQQIKAGLMHDLFTRGVTPDGRLRPTRSEAPQLYKESPLGWIPKEWDCNSLADSCELLKDGTHLPPLRVSAGPLLLSVQNMIDGYLRLTTSDTRVPEEFYTQMHRNWMIKPNDVLLAIVGATIGKVCRVPDNFPKFTLQRSVSVLRGKHGVLSNQFLYWYLLTPAFKNLLWQRVNQTAQPGIYLDQIGKIIVPIPPGEEQCLISRVHEAAETSIRVTKDDRAKLYQQKHGLMHDLLTGRVRVKVAESAAA